MPPLIKDFSWTIISDLLLVEPRLVTENKCLWLPEGMVSYLAIFVLFIIGLTLALLIPQLLGDRQRQAKLYRLTLSTVSDAVFITDRWGYFSFICPNVDNIFGYTSQEVADFGNIAKLLGENIFDAQDLESLGEIQNIEREITDKKGKKHNLLVNIKRVAINKGCYLYTCHDITERKQTEEELHQYRHRLEKLVDIRTAELAKVNEQLAQEIRERQQTEEALRESQQQLATIAANIPGVVFRYIIHPDGKISIPYISPGLQELIGVSAEEIIAHPERVFDRVHGEDRLQLEKAIAASAKSLTPLNHEYRLISTSGKEQWVRAIARLHRLNNNDIVLDGLSLDITPYKFAQEALRESEATNRALISGIPDALFGIHRDGTYLDFVPSSEVELLVSPSEFLGKKIADIFPASMAIEQMIIINKAVESGNTEIYEYQLPIGGRTRDYEARIVVTGKAKDRVLAIVRDISDRKQAERALQAQIQRTELILQTAIDGFCMMSLNGCFINVNPAFCSIVGYSQAEILGTDIRDLEVLESSEETARHLENIFQVGCDHFETKLRRKDGQIVDIEASSTFAEIGESRFIFSFVRDITERKQIEASLHLQAQIIDQIHDAVIVTDLDCYVKSWNRGAERLYGYLAAEAIDKHILFLHEPYGELFWQQQVIQPLLEKGQHDLELKACKKRGENIWVHLSLSLVKDYRGNAIGMIGYSIDINDRKLAESALRESEERFRQLAENLTDVFWMMTAEKKQILYVSPAFESMSGYAQEILYQNPSSLIAAFHPEDRDRILAAFLKIPTEKYDEEYRIIKPDGTIRWIRSRAFPIEKQEGEIYRIAGISQDITEQKQAEEERDRIFNLSLDLLGIAGFDGYFKRVNPAVTKILGYSHEELLSKPFFSFIHPEDRAATFRQVKKLITGESILYFENRYLCKDGTYKWLTWTAFPVQAARLIYAVARDTTERRKAEEALKESREKYRVLFEIFPLGITLTDETGNIIDANPASEEILGLSKKEHTTTTLDSKKWQILRPNGTLMPTDEFASVRALKENRLIENVEMGIIKTHNKITWLNVTAAPIPLKGYGVAVAYIDITERKQAQEALRQQEKEYRTLAENTPDIIARFDKELRHIYVNPAVEQVTGIAAQEFIGKTNREIGFPASLLSRWEETMRQVFETGCGYVLEFEYSALNKMRYYQARIVPELTADGTVEFILATTRDITDLKQMEESLRVAQARLEHLVTTSPAIIYSCKASGDYGATFISNNITSMVGYEVREFLEDSRFWIDRIHPEDIDRILTELPLLYENGHHVHEYRFQHKDGNYRWMYDQLQLLRDAKGNPLEIVGSWIDITDRKQAETSLKYRAALQQLIGDISTNFLNLPSTEIDRGINQALQALGEFIGVDRAYVFMFAEGSTKMRNTHQWGLRNVEPEISIQGLSLEDLAFSSQLLKRGETLIIRCLTDLAETAKAEKTELESQGIKSLLLVPLIAGGSVVGAIGCDTIVADKTWTEDCITLLKIVGEIIVTAMERRHFEQQLEQRAADLTRSNAELEQFAYVASHDLQEPLRMVASYTQLLARRYSGQLDPKADKYIAYAVDGAIRMQQLIQDLLKYSRVGTRGKEFAPVNCQTVFATAVKNLEIAIKESGALVTCDSLPVVIGDDIQLVQLFQNLIGNAIKYRGDRSPIVNVKAQYRGAAWLFSVSDNGIGIASQHAERIFQIFQRLHTREEYPGTGIGLAICKKIVERHGGRIWLESKLGEGATFYFTISDSESTLL